MQGKFLILMIFGTALAAAVFAWSFQYLRGRRILELWGADNARLIRVDAEKITLLVLAEGDASEDEVEIDGVPHGISQGKEILEVPGIIHARQSLIEDASFLWEKPRGDCEAQWTRALRVSRGEHIATVLFDTNCGRARLLETGNEAAIAPKIFSGWQTFLDEQLEETAKAVPDATVP